MCVISGESGAGKTESAKLFIKHIISLSNKAVRSGDEKALEDKIVDLNPLMEGFGNAQTLMNDNSSRFGKFIELRFNSERVSVSRCVLFCYCALSPAMLIYILECPAHGVYGDWLHAMLSL